MIALFFCTKKQAKKSATKERGKNISRNNRKLTFRVSLRANITLSLTLLLQLKSTLVIVLFSCKNKQGKPVVLKERAVIEQIFPNKRKTSGHGKEGYFTD